MAKESTKLKSPPSQEEPKPLSLRVASPADKDGPGAQQGAIGVRSPLFAQGANKRSESSQSIPIASETPKAPNRLAAVTGTKPSSVSAEKEAPPHSSINGLDDPILATRETKEFVPIQHYMFDESGQKLARAFKLLLMLATLALALAIGLIPDFRSDVWSSAERAHSSLMSYVAPSRQKTVIRDVSTTESMDDTSPQSAEQRLVAKSRNQNVASGSSCYGLISAFVSGSRLNLAQRIDTAECYLQRSDAQGATKVLTPLKGEIQKTSESALNKMGADHTLVDAYHLMVMARTQINRFQEASELTRNHCSRWKRSNTCVTKLSLYAARKLALPSSVNELFTTQNDLSAKSQSRLWLAGALYGEKQETPSTVLKRYQLAVKAAPPKGLALRREIYEAHSFYLHKIGALERLRDVASRGLGDLRALDSQSLIKLRFLSQLGRDPDQSRFMRLSMSRNELRVAARHDLRLVHVLGIESLKHGVVEIFQRLLSEIESFYLAKGDAFTSEKRLLSTWRVRLLLYKGEAKLALQTLSEMQSSKELDATENHLRGVAYAQDSSAPRYQGWAADSFRKAKSLRYQPESDLAMGFALLRSGKTEETADIIKDLNPKITSGPLKYWLDMLKAEWSLSSGKLQTAESICRLWARKMPSYTTPVRLQIEILTKMGNLSGAQSLREDLDDRATHHRWPESEEALLSPFGPLSLADRGI